VAERHDARPVTEPVGINKAGDIIGYGVLPNGHQHNFLLIPNKHR
jgi:hypothetical protein